MKKQNTFFNLWDEVEKTTPFNPEWENSAGYFDPLIDVDLGLEHGQRIKAEADDGRKIIIVGTKFGNVIFFHRYNDNENIVVASASKVVKDLYVTDLMTSIRHASLTYLAGAEYNIGRSLQAFDNLNKKAS